MRFRIGVLDSATGAGAPGFPVQARVIDPSGITVIKRDVVIGYQGTGDFRALFHRRSRAGTYRFEFVAGDRTLVWEIPLLASPDEKVIERRVNQFLRGFLPIPLGSANAAERFVTRFESPHPDPEREVTLEVQKEPRFWVFADRAPHDVGDVWECWFRNRFLMTSGLAHPLPLKASIERTGDRTGILAFSRWNVRGPGREQRFLFPAMAETTPARECFRDLTLMVENPRDEVYRALLNPGDPSSIEGRIYGGDSKTVVWVRRSGRILLAFLGCIIGLYLLIPAYMPGVAATQLAGLLLLAFLVAGRQALPDWLFVCLCGVLFVAGFWPA
ncbi:MAG TPA: hypothetical protein PKO06_25080, partial [Candidatus Ozemobacteraceae bacterium]|nr:hypothetical protein [Candidatus Ozemobacteraceae bacterium]